MRTKILCFTVVVLLGFSIVMLSLAAEPDQGKVLYLKYCGSCHGKDGKGRGPVSAHLKIRVPDLTLLKRNSGGIFPLADVMAAIDGTKEIKGHGNAAMPVWGEVFEKEMEGRKYQTLTSLLKVKIIGEYLSSIQR